MGIQKYTGVTKWNNLIYKNVIYRGVRGIRVWFYLVKYQWICNIQKCSWLKQKNRCTMTQVSKPRPGIQILLLGSLQNTTRKEKKNKTQHSCLCDEVRTNFSSYRHVCDFTITPPQMVFQNSFLIRIKNCLSQLLKCFQNNTWQEISQIFTELLIF